MKKLFPTLIFIFSLAGVSNAQLPLGYLLRETMDLYETNKLASGNYKNILTEKDIKGSPYLNDEFETGSIYTVQRIQYADIPLRYNIFNDDIEFKTPTGEVQALATPEIVEKAVFGNTLMIYSPYLLGNKNKKGFFIILVEGKASLYAKPNVIFKDATEAAAYKEPEPAMFVKKSDEYFIRIGAGQAQIIGGKKELISAFPDNQDKIDSFISKNKIKINKPESLKELFDYYNSL
jgi:hypothetical protein